MSDEQQEVLVERADGVVTVTLNRPERKNAITMTMWSALTATLGEVARREDDRVLVLTGAGGAFTAGADVSRFEGPDPRPLDRMRALADAALELHRLPQPTIAKVGGDAVGAGCNLALGCDLIVAGRSARFSEIFPRRGLSLDCGGSWLLPRLVGLHKAKELALFGDLLSAEQAAAIGIVNRVVDDGELDALVDEWAGRLAAGPPVALATTKALLNAGVDASLQQAVQAEAHAQVSNLTNADLPEAMAAYREKREPRFTGRSALAEPGPGESAGA